MGMFGTPLRNPLDKLKLGFDGSVLPGDGNYPPATMPEAPMRPSTDPFGFAQMPMAGDITADQGMMARPAKPKFGEPGGWGERLGAIGSVLLNAAGVQDNGYDQYQQLREMRRQQQRQQQLAEAARYAPQNVNGNIVRLNPQTGQYETLYNGQKPPAPGADEQLLIASGLEPGTPQYQAAARSLFDRKSDPFVTLTLPDGRIYTGPQSGLQVALGGGSPKAAPPGVTFTPLPDNGPAMTPTSAAPVLRGAQATSTITRAQAAQIRASLGPNGQAAFEQWLAAHNITVGDQ